VFGALFRYRQQSKKKIELLVIMTPHVIRCPADAEFIWGTESQKLDLNMADVLKLQGVLPPSRAPWEVSTSNSTGLPLPPGAPAVIRTPALPAGLSLPQPAVLPASRSGAPSTLPGSLPIAPGIPTTMAPPEALPAGAGLQAAAAILEIQTTPPFTPVPILQTSAVGPR
jgi:hypothetical protein